MKSGELAALTAVVMSALAFLGITRIDASLVSNFLNGIFAAIAIVSGIVSWYKHRTA